MTYARQLWEQIGKEGSFTMSHMSVCCSLPPEHDFTWFLGQEHVREDVRRPSPQELEAPWPSAV